MFNDKWLEKRIQNPKNISCELNFFKRVFGAKLSILEYCGVKYPNIDYCRLIDLIPWIQIPMFNVT